MGFDDVGVLLVGLAILLLVAAVLALTFREMWAEFRADLTALPETRQRGRRALIWLAAGFVLWGLTVVLGIARVSIDGMVLATAQFCVFMSIHHIGWIRGYQTAARSVTPSP
jgi:hypothetical protein